MKKSTIWFLTVIMALALMGLLYVQIMYLRNMVKMRDDQFAEGVKSSLYTVTTRLEQDEAKHFLDQDLANIETSALPGYNDDGTAIISIVTGTFTTPQGFTGDITLTGSLNADSNSGGASRYRTSQETLRSLYMYQKGLLNEVVLNIINRSSDRPLAERADSARVASYLRAEFSNNGLDLPFEFAVTNRAGALVYSSEGYTRDMGGSNNMFVQTLFPSDTRKMGYIKVYFPTKQDYIFSSIKFMIPSFIFTLILIMVFVYTIIMAFRQKKLTEMKNDFINNMTHEFKTPISTISLAAQMLNDPAVLKSENMLRHISGVINDETKRLRFQVEKVLQMSLFDRQPATMRLTEVDANVVISNIVHTFNLKVEKFGGKIEEHLDADDAIVNVDEMHFTNVIFNLLDNAVKYRREEEPLHLTVSTRDIDSDRRLKITIGDNGIGIRRDDLKRIFEKFYRVSTGNRHDVKGFGLGLAYVKKIVTELGGEITVESEYNHGTKFNIILPLTKN